VSNTSILGAAMSLLHKADVYQSPNEASDSRNIDPASNEFSQLVVLPFICSGIAVAAELENTSSSFDCEQFWQGYIVMSGIIFVLLAMEILIFGVL
jgi:hypothetical protein